MEEKQKIIKNYDDVPFKSKWQEINFLNRWGLIISSGLMTTTLIISWLFWITIYRSNIDELLTTIAAQDFPFNFHFLELSVCIFIFAISFLGLITFPFIFLKKNNLTSLIISFITISIVIILLIGWIVFGFYSINGFQIYIERNSLSSVLFFIVPWIFTIIFAIAIFIFCSWLIINNFLSTKKPKLHKQQFEQNFTKEENLYFNEMNNSTNIVNENKNIFEEIPNNIDEDSKLSKQPMRKKDVDDKADFTALESNRLKNSPTNTPATMIKEKTITPTEVIVNSSKNSTFEQEEPIVISNNEESLKIFKDNNTIKPTTNFIKSTYPTEKSSIPLSSSTIETTYSTVEESQPKIVYTTTANTNESISSTTYKAEISQPLNPPNNKEQEILSSKTIVPSKVWTEEQINTAWEKGFFVDTYDQKTYRKDYAGALMFKHNFVVNPTIEENNPRSYNWTIVYQQPLSQGGSDEPSNLWPLNCMNAISKGNNFPKWKTTISFNGKENYIKVKKWKGKSKKNKSKT